MKRRQVVEQSRRGELLDLGVFTSAAQRLLLQRAQTRVELVGAGWIRVARGQIELPLSGPQMAPRSHEIQCELLAAVGDENIARTGSDRLGAARDPALAVKAHASAVQPAVTPCDLGTRVQRLDAGPETRAILSQATGRASISARSPPGSMRIGLT